MVASERKVSTKVEEKVYKTVVRPAVLYGLQMVPFFPVNAKKCKFAKTHLADLWSKFNQTKNIWNFLVTFFNMLKLLQFYLQNLLLTV